jgi:hypothetical protein
MLRNEPLLTILAVGIIAFGFLFVIVAFIVLTSTSEKRNAYAARWFALASAMIVFGIVGGVFVAAKSASLQEEPSIVAGLTGDGPHHLDATVTASGMRADQRLNVQVTGYLPGETAEERTSEKVFLSVSGPDPTGVVTIPIAIPIRSATYSHLQIAVWRVGDDEPDCNQAQAGLVTGSACARLVMADAPRPGEGD